MTLQDKKDLPGTPGVKNFTFQCRGASSIHDEAVKIPHVSWPKKQTIKQKQYCNKFNKDFKNWPTLKILKIKRFF